MYKQIKLSSNLRNHHHRLSFFYFNHHPRYGMPALPGTIAWDATSNLGFHYLSSISLLLCHKAILSWLHGWPMSLGWLIVLYLDKTTTKHEEIYLEWSRFPYCLGHFSVLLDEGSLEETFVFPFFPITATWLLLGHLLTLYKGDWSFVSFLISKLIICNLRIVITFCSVSAVCIVYK